MNTLEFDSLTLAQQDAFLAALRALIGAIYAQRSGASEPPPVPIERRGVKFGTAKIGLRGREN